MKVVRTHSFLCAPLLGAVALFTTGCPSGVRESYSLEERTPVMEDSLPRTVRRADGFASDLCVVKDEYSSDESYVTSGAVALFNINGRETLHNKKAFERLYPASITKVVIALVTIKNGDLNARVVMTDNAVVTESGATLCGIELGDILTLEQLLHRLMLSSDNGAGVAITVYIAGSTDKLADMMNQEVASLEATETHFVSPYGLDDPNHYTTTHDLYLIFSEVLEHPVSRQIVDTISYTANYHDRDSRAVTKTWEGGNQLITRERETPEGLTVSGGKTGTTDAVGYCLVMAIRGQDDKKYISVVLKSDNRLGLYDNITNIISKIVKQ